MPESFHFNISMISRGKGKSAVASSAYLAREKITNEWDGITHDYQNKKDLIYKEIFLPEYAKEEFREKWDKKYPNILKSWDKNWNELTTFFEYPQEIRKIIYTTNTVESYHRMVRKFTKSKVIFPTDDYIRKVIYMSVMQISKKWTMPVHNWGLAYSQLFIFFEDRFAS